MSGTSHLRAAALMAGLLLASPASAWKIVADGQPYAHAGTGYSI